MPVHINVPISEPLFDFNTSSLPAERKIEMSVPTCHIDEIDIKPLLDARRPIIVIGQLKHDEHLSEIINEVKKSFVVLHEPLSVDEGAT